MLFSSIKAKNTNKKLLRLVCKFNTLEQDQENNPSDIIQSNY